MRPIWNGAISFGLVSIPIKLVNATEHHSISFRQIHTADGGRIRYRKVCELDGEEIPASEIGKGYEEPGGGIMPITDEDLAALPLPTAKTIEIVTFVPAAEIDPLQMDSTYYLSANGVPAATGRGGYQMLSNGVERVEKTAGSARRRTLSISAVATSGPSGGWPRSFGRRADGGATAGWCGRVRRGRP